MGQPELGIGFSLQGDLRTYAALDEVFQADHQLLQRHRLRIQGLAPGKGQQPMGESGGALGGAAGGTGVALEVLQPALAQAQVEHLQRAEDAGQQVVEVMGDATGELADGFHLL